MNRILFLYRPALIEVTSMECKNSVFAAKTEFSHSESNYPFYCKLVLPLILFLIIGLMGCGCCLVGGGDTGRANRLDYAHKKMGIGVGGPGWSMLTRLGARFVQEEEPGAAMLIRGVKRIQISEFTLEKPTEARREEIFNLYAELMRKQGWRLLTRVYEDKHDSCIFAQYDEDSFRGIFVVSIQGKEMHVILVTQKGKKYRCHKSLRGENR